MIMSEIDIIDDDHREGLRVHSPALLFLNRVISGFDGEETVTHITALNDTFCILQHDLHLALGF